MRLGLLQPLKPPRPVPNIRPRVPSAIWARRSRMRLTGADIGTLRATPLLVRCAGSSMRAGPEVHLVKAEAADLGFPAEGVCEQQDDVAEIALRQGAQDFDHVGIARHVHPRPIDWRIGNTDRRISSDAGTVEQSLPDRPGEEARQRAFRAAGLDWSAAGGDLHEQRGHAAALGCLRELEPMQRRGVLHEVSVDALEAPKAQLGLLVDKIGAQRVFEGLARACQGLGPVTGGVLAEPSASIKPRGDVARLRCGDGGDGADRHAALAPTAAIAENPLRAVWAQADAEAGNGVVPDLGLALARRQRERGKGVLSELHRGRSRGAHGERARSPAFVPLPPFNSWSKSFFRPFRSPSLPFATRAPNGASRDPHEGERAKVAARFAADPRTVQRIGRPKEPHSSSVRDHVHSAAVTPLMRPPKWPANAQGIS